MAIGQTLQQMFPGWELILFFGLVFLFFMGGAIATFVVLSRMRWNWKVLIFEELPNGTLWRTGKDKARKIAAGNRGEELFLLKRSKKLKVGFGKTTGLREISFVIAKSDGFWYNATIGSFDKKLKEIGIVPIDKDQRYAVGAVQKLVDKNYGKSDWSQWMPYIAMGMLFLMVIAFLIGGYVIGRQNIKVSQNFNSAAEKIDHGLTAIDSSLDKQEVIAGGGSGLIPIPIS